MEDSPQPYAGLYPFQVDPQTHAIHKARTKKRQENEDASLQTTLWQLLLEDGNNDPSSLPLALSSSEDPVALTVILGPQGQSQHEPIYLQVLRRFRDSVKENGANGPYTLTLLENLN
jgi:hypothetical protein